MNTEVTLSGQIDSWPSKNEMAKLLEDAGLAIAVGEYSIRILDCEHFVFQHYGGDLSKPHIDADASSLERMKQDANRVSSVLAAANIRHRFEIYDDDDSLVGGFSHE